MQCGMTNNSELSNTSRFGIARPNSKAYIIKSDATGRTMREEMIIVSRTRPEDEQHHTAKQQGESKREQEQSDERTPPEQPKPQNRKKRSELQGLERPSGWKGQPNDFRSRVPTETTHAPRNVTRSQIAFEQADAVWFDIGSISTEKDRNTNSGEKLSMQSISRYGRRRCSNFASSQPTSQQSVLRSGLQRDFRPSRPTLHPQNVNRIRNSTPQTAKRSTCRSLMGCDLDRQRFQNINSQRVNENKSRNSNTTSC